MKIRLLNLRFRESFCPVLGIVVLSDIVLTIPLKKRQKLLEKVKETEEFDSDFEDVDLEDENYLGY